MSPVRFNPTDDKIYSDESKQKMREAKLSKPGPWKGKSRPEETRRKIGETQRKKNGTCQI
jgi:hypothetical protein